MKYSMFLAATSAVLAVAGPLNKRAMETKVVVDWVTVTVTAGEVQQTVEAVEEPQESPTKLADAAVAQVVETVEPDTYTAVAVPLVSTTKTSTTSVTQPKPTTTTKTTSKSTLTSTSSKAATSQTNSNVQTLTAPSITDYEATALYHHNVHRLNNSVARMFWDEDLADYAEQTARTCKFAHDTTPGKGVVNYGQNIAMWGSTGDVKAYGAGKAGAGAISGQWYNGEVNAYLPSYYGQDNPDLSTLSKWGHYSQMVWKSTTKVGCASVYCPINTMSTRMATWFTVCDYFPRGNMGGQYGKNVLEPLGKDTVTA